MQEAKFGIRFSQWLKVNYDKFQSGSFETKDTRGEEYFNMRELKDAQRCHAKANKSERGNLIRVSVGTTGCGDYIFLKGSEAWVAINYPSGFVVIDIDILLKEECKRLSYQKALELSTYKFSL